MINFNIKFRSFRLVYMVLGGVAIIGGACERFLEIAPPRNELLKDAVYGKEATANASVLTIYSRLTNQAEISYRIPLYTGIAGDELRSYSTTPDIKEIYTNSMLAKNGKLFSLWSSIYSIIYQTNDILESIEVIGDFEPIVKRQLVGEALFLRAFSYFYLVNFFGKVPLITTTDYEKNRIAESSDTAVIYDFIITTLNAARDSLGNQFLGADGRTASNERVRANRYAALALLARVNLYNRNYLNAERNATEIIDENELFRLDSNLNNISIMNNDEAIWQLQTFQSYQNTIEGGFLFVGNTPYFGERSSSGISPQLLQAFEVGDKRRVNWIKSTPNAVYNYPYKYKVGFVAVITEYSTVFRLAEQYLIRAEARAYLDDIDGAIEDINIVRKRAGLNNTSAVTREDVLKAVMHERQTELFVEWGHRWMDLKRTGSIDNVMQVVAPLKVPSGNWEKFKALFPIPSADRQNNTNLEQNPGYD